MFNLFVNVKNFVCRVGEDADVLMTLYDAKLGCFFSESYIVQWGNQGMPKNLDMLNNLRVIFTVSIIHAQNSISIQSKNQLRELRFLI